MKQKCEWCGKEEYHIGILRDDKEELICKKCFEEMIEENYDNPTAVLKDKEKRENILDSTPAKNPMP